MLGRVVTFVAGGWLTMSAFAWPQSDAACAAACSSGLLAVVYGVLEIFLPRIRYLNTANACVLCLLSLWLDSSSAARANSVMIAAVLFGASLLSAPEVRPQRATAWAIAGSKASSTGRPCTPGGAA